MVIIKNILSIALNSLRRLINGYLFQTIGIDHSFTTGFDVSKVRKRKLYICSWDHGCSFVYQIQKYINSRLVQAPYINHFNVLARLTDPSVASGIGDAAHARCIARLTEGRSGLKNSKGKTEDRERLPSPSRTRMSTCHGVPVARSHA